MNCETCRKATLDVLIRTLNRMTHREDATNQKRVSQRCDILNALEGIQMDGRRFALYDNAFVVSDLVKFDLQFRTNQTEGLLIWHKDQRNDNSIVVEMERGQVVTRVVCGDEVYSARSQFQERYLSNGNWHCLNIRICANHIEMSVDNRAFRRTQTGVVALNVKGPLFLCGRPEGLVPDFVAVRSKSFWKGGIRELRVNNINVNWLPRSLLDTPAASPELRKLVRNPTLSSVGRDQIRY